MSGNLDPEDGCLPIRIAVATNVSARAKANGLTHVEMHPHVLMTLHGMSALHRGEETPFAQRFQQ